MLNESKISAMPGCNAGGEIMLALYSLASSRLAANPYSSREIVPIGFENLFIEKKPPNALIC